MNENLLNRSFSNRLIALDTIEKGDADTMEASADEFNLLGEECGSFFPGSELRAFSNVLFCLSMAQRWVESVRGARHDGNNFRDACRLRAKESFDPETHEIDSLFTGVLSELADLDKPENVRILRKRILSTPLPFGMKGEENTPPYQPETEKSVNREITRLEIAFVKFDIDGCPAKQINTLKPNVLYDIGINIRVSRWPRSAHSLVVTPISIEPSDMYDLPTFTIQPPTEDDGGGPYVFQRQGRMLLKFATSFGARPFEFKYRAVFEPSLSEQPLDIFGHRSLRLESVDDTTRGLSGYREIDKKIQHLRDELRNIPGIPDEDLSNVLEVIASLGNLAGQALSDSLFEEGTNEEVFQKEVLKNLRRWPRIGEELEVHPNTGGGICDLSFRRIRIELKVAHAKKLDDSKINKFSKQTAQYVVSSGKRIGVLCILDSRKKTKPPELPEDHMRIVMEDSGNTSIPIVCLQIEGGLSKPSDLSR